MLLPVLRKLLLEMLQEVDLIGVHTPRRAAPQGNVLGALGNSYAADFWR
jgi:hypothetical protein